MALLFAYVTQRSSVDEAIDNFERHHSFEVGALLVGEIDGRAAAAADAPGKAEARNVGDRKVGDRKVVRIGKPQRAVIERAIRPRRMLEQRAQLLGKLGSISGGTGDLGLALPGRHFGEPIEELAQTLEGRLRSVGLRRRRLVHRMIRRSSEEMAAIVPRRGARTAAPLESAARESRNHARRRANQATASRIINVSALIARPARNDRGR